MSGTTRFLDVLNEEADTLNLNCYHGDITTIAKVDAKNDLCMDDDEEEEVVIGLSGEDRTSAYAQMDKYENRLITNTIANRNNSTEIGTIGGTDREEVEEVKVLPSPRNVGCKEQPKLNLE